MPQFLKELLEAAVESTTTNPPANRSNWITSPHTYPPGTQYHPKANPTQSYPPGSTQQDFPPSRAKSRGRGTAAPKSPQSDVSRAILKEVEAREQRF